MSSEIWYLCIKDPLGLEKEIVKVSYPTDLPMPSTEGHSGDEAEESFERLYSSKYKRQEERKISIWNNI